MTIGVAAVAVVALVARFQLATTPVPAMDDCAGVVRVVAEERISDEDAALVASGLSPCLEQIGEVALGAANDPDLPDDPEGFGRPKVVRMFERLGSGDGGQDRLVESFRAWAETRLARLASPAPLTQVDARADLRRIGLVLAAASTGLDEVESNRGARFTGRTIVALKRDVATKLAEATGAQPPADSRAEDELLDGHPLAAGGSFSEEASRSVAFDYLTDFTSGRASRSAAGSVW